MRARTRLALSYGGFLLLAVLALLALLVYVIRFVPEGNLTGTGGFVPDRDDLLTALWPRVVLVVAVLAVVGSAAAWFVAGRVVRPLRQIHGVAVEVASGQLDRRVALGGPRDELGELADAVDTMLDRLQQSLDEQRRFAANASHELRTPYAIERAVLDVALADPAGVDLDRLLRRLDETNRRGSEVIETLLVLSALDHGRTPETHPVDVAEVVADVVAELAPLAEEGGITVRCALGEGDVDGSGSLVRLLVANLVLNGIRHNTGPGGHVEVRTATAADGGVDVLVASSGPVVPPEQVRTLTEPFVRGAGRVVADPGGRARGSGLGLTVVARIAAVHGARLALLAPPTGGLEVRVHFPAPPG